MAKAPIFIVGPPRTGTTLTARILGGHSDIHISPVELFFFQLLYERRQALGQPDGEEATTRRLIQALRKIAYKKRREKAYWHALGRIFADPAFLEGMKQARSYGEVLDCFMQAQASEAGKTRWGNQVPSDLFALDHIFAFYPDARVVICVRHPLDYLVSCRDVEAKALRRNNIAKARRAHASYDPVLTSLHWDHCLRHARKALRQRPDQVCISRYEDLVGAPETQVTKLCRFLEVPFEPSMLAVNQNNSSRKVKSSGIFSSSVDQWRTNLSPEIAHTCQTLCRRNMSFLGYPRETIKHRPGSFLRHILATPLAAGRAFVARSRLEDSATPYSLKRLVS